MIPGQSRTIACIGASYITKLLAAAVIIFALGEMANVADMWLQVRRGD